MGWSHRALRRSVFPCADVGAFFERGVLATGWNKRVQLGSAIRDARFWCYALSFTLACIAVTGTATHLQPLLASKGFTLYNAVSLGVAYSIAISLGKVLGGFLLDRIWPFGVVSVICVMASAGAFAEGARVDDHDQWLLR